MSTTTMKKILLFKIVILLSLIVILSINIHGYNEIIDSQETYDGISALGCSNNHKIFCSNFTSSSTYFLGKTGLHIKRTNGEPSDYNMISGIFSSNDGKPFERLSSSYDINTSLLGLTSNWFNFTYINSLQLTENTQYWICANISYTNNACEFYVALGRNEGSASGKVILRSADGGVNWVNDFGDDFQTDFRNYNISCSYNLINTSWSEWLNLSCLIDDTINQSRYLTEYDSNFCGEYENITYYEYRNTEFCDYCIPNMTNNTPSGWLNISECFYGDYINKSRYFTEYDINFCGEEVNITHYEYDIDYCLYIEPITPEYNISLLPENIYNKDIFNTNTITGVFMFIFIFLILCGIAVLGEVTRIPIFMFITGFLGIFFGILVFTTISSVFGTVLVILSGLYLLSIFMR